ncbi:hypothetical protein T040910_082 [Synechococcus phage S-CAM3]|uniref:Uncharacterized protein n=1 Tax=Synechococcus phage S-CAM3 TaxID=1883366 RepID=A0A1D8KJK6_9CAUD|nr:hypothetical protein BOW87_gp176 [Synechococcus phage S-CAM3]AOV58587.1 hypothetical protein S250808_082 [Synechococcus phage S-CAM3]AOV58826.1 hypothetical protein T040910_082 [Synechococcus phage S-CAM3]AOV59065.1 hypothetical protein C421010_082 [Synechococcus phage S-CAM3]
MGNSPTDKSKNFIASGMTLITQIDSDKYLKASGSKKKKEDDKHNRTQE